MARLGRSYPNKALVSQRLILQSVAAPYIVGRDSSVEGSAVTTHDVDLVLGALAGDIILIAANINGATTVTGPAGYTELVNVSDAAPFEYRVWWKPAVGGETTVQFTTGTAVASSHLSYAIRNANPPQVSAGASGTSTNPDPAAITPSGGLASYLFLAIHVAKGISGTTTAGPAGYVQVNTADGLGGAKIAGAERNGAVTTEDPGSFTLSTSLAWQTSTIAFATAGTAQPATVTPAVIPTVAALPTPTINVAVATTVTPAVIAATVTLPTPTVLAAAKVTPTVIAAVASLPTPTILAASQVTPATIAAVAALPTPAILAASKVLPATIAALVALPTPTINVAGGATTVQPATIAAVVALPTPQPVVPALVTPAVIAVTVTVPTPTILLAANVSPATIAVVASLPTPTVSIPGLASPAVIAVVVALPTPTVVMSAVVLPATIAVLVTLPTPTVTTAGNVTPATIALIVTLPTPTIVIGAVTFWTRNPAGYTVNGSPYTRNPAAYVPVGGGDDPPW